MAKARVVYTVVVHGACIGLHGKKHHQLWRHKLPSRSVAHYTSAVTRLHPPKATIVYQLGFLQRTSKLGVSFNEWAVEIGAPQQVCKMGSHDLCLLFIEPPGKMERVAATG